MTGTEFFYALLAGLVPSLVWLFFWTREDEDQPEPKSLLAACFLAGMLCVIAAIPLEKAAAAFATSQYDQYLVWAVIEEALKFVAVAAVALRTRWDDEPIDAMIYCIAVALGFAALENTLFVLGAVSSTGSLASSIVTANMRFFGATLVHVLSSALIGFGIGLAFYSNLFAKMTGWILGLGAAIAVHAAFNLTIVNSGPADALRVFGWVWAGVVILIVLFEEIKAVHPGHAPVFNTTVVSAAPEEVV